MKISLHRVIFVLVSLVIVAVAYLPMFNLSGGSGVGNPTYTRYIYAYSQLHVYGAPLYTQWDIAQFEVSVRGPPNPGQAMDFWFPTGQVCAVYNLYNEKGDKLGSGTVCNPAKMDATSSTWDNSWAFMHIPNGQYTVGVTYYENNVPKTNELKKAVTVS